MLTKQKYVFEKGKDGCRWIDVPIEKNDIIEYIEKHIKYIECNFTYHKDSYFLDEICFLRHCVLAFGDVGILEYQEIKKYIQISEEFSERYLELKKDVSVS